MADVKFPVIELENNSCEVIVDLSIYSQEAVTATCYKYSGDYYIHQIKNTVENNSINVFFESKSKCRIDADVPKQFCCDLIDQQLRVDVNNRFGYIRDMIVEEAFKPVNNNK